MRHEPQEHPAGDTCPQCELDEVADAIWNLRLQLKDRWELIQQRISKAEVNSRPWHQLQGQSLELDRMMRRLENLPS